MYAGKVELCGVDTARLPVLSEAEKSRLIKAARAGDRQARQEMVQGNLRLVLSVVQRFAGRGENMVSLHNGKIVFDENVIKHGVTGLSAIALEYLAQ